MMCPGKEFGIMDTVLGVIEVAIFLAVQSALGGLPWWSWALFIVSTIGWFGMAAYCFRFAAKCNCQEVYKRMGIK